MKIDIAYGEGQVSLMVPPGQTVDFVTPREITAHEDLGAAVDRALGHPVEAPPLEDVIASTVGPDRTVLLVVSDLTRSGGTKDVLPVLTARLEAMGVRRGRLRILIARGTHRRLTKEERRYFKSDPFVGIQVDEHDCDDNASMSALVLTKRGTPVRISRSIREAGLAILVSPISFHYFAGFGGGRKLILPGSADRAAILANHRLSLLESRPVRLHPRCQPGNLEDNPVSDDMGEALAALTNVYGVNFFGDRNGKTVFVNSGDPVIAHEEACELYRELHRVP